MAARGVPFAMIRELARQTQKGLTIIKNDANEAEMGLDHLLAGGQVAKLITTHIDLNPRAIEMMNDSRLEVEFCAQGILEERVRAGGAGLEAIVTDIGLDTDLANGKPRVSINGMDALLETALRADFALIHADRVIAEVETILLLGGVLPDNVHTPGPFVDHVVPLGALSEEYDVVRR